MPQNTEYRKILHRMGYYSYQDGLINRHLNQEGGWDKHHERCREYILKAVDLFRPEKITVLGSGWLLDLPLSEMLERTEKINLIDIVHPPEVYEQAGALGKIIIKEEDVTGGLVSNVWNEAGKYGFIKKMKDLSGIKVPIYKFEEDPGLVISLNILTQLENLPVEFIKKRSRIDDEHFITFRKEVQRRHIEFLSGLRSVLISDVEEIRTNKNREETVIPTLVAEIPEGTSREEWTWDFDLKGSDFYNTRSTMKVVAVTFGK